MANTVTSPSCGGAQPSGGLAQGDHHGMGGRVVRLADSIVGPGDHRIVDHGHRGTRTFASLDRQASLCQGLAHEQLVVHAADDTGRSAPFDGSG